MKHFITIAWRTIKRHKGFSFINLLGLALGFTCTILIVLWVWDELAFDAFHENTDRLYRVLENQYYADGEPQTTPATPGVLGKALQLEIPDIECAAQSTWGVEELVTVGERSHRETGRFVEPGFLTMFTFPLKHGDPKSALSAPNAIVISETMAHAYFGDENPIGKTVRINNRDDFEVTGIIRDVPRTSSIGFSFLIPYETWVKRNQWVTSWENNGPSTYLLLKRGVSQEHVESLIKNFVRNKLPDPSKGNVELILQRFDKGYLHSDFRNGRSVGGRVDAVRTFSLVAIIVLLIAGINFVNLSTAQAFARSKEIGIRKLQGAGTRNLLLQFMGEAVLFALAALIVAGTLVEIALPSFRSVTAKDLSLDYGNPLVLLSLLGMGVGTGLLSGGYPAAFMASLDALNVLRGNLRLGGKTIMTRKGLVVLQFCLTSGLVFCTLVVHRQMIFIQNKPLGFDRENLVLIGLEGDLSRRWETLTSEAGRIPGVLSATVSTTSPLVGGNTTIAVDWPGKLPTEKVLFTQMGVGHNYTQTMGIQLAEGRDFSQSRPGDSASFVINEETVRRMRLAHPVGSTISFWNTPGTVIGVMKDYHINSLRQPIDPVILHLNPQWANHLIVRIEAGRTAPALEGLRDLVANLNPGFPFEYRFVEETFDQQYRRERTTRTLAGAFSFMAIAISSLGLLGLVVFTTGQRKKEIGVRKVLGASVGTILAILSKDYLILVGLAFTFSAPVAWYLMTGWLENFAYRVEISWDVFVASAVVSLLVAALSISIQGLRAASANPVENLRNE